MFLHTNQNLSLKILWDFDIRMDHPVTARKLELFFDQKKKTYRLADFIVLANQTVKIKAKK